MKKRNIVFIVTLLTVFIYSIGFAAQQDGPKISKGQLLPAPKIVRSSKVNRHIDKKHHPLKTNDIRGSSFESSSLCSLRLETVYRVY